MLFRYLNGAQLCRKHRQHHFGVYLCAQPLQGGICQTHRLPRLCALHRGAGTAAQTSCCHGAEIGQQGGGGRFILFIGGKQHGGSVAIPGGSGAGDPARSCMTVSMEKNSRSALFCAQPHSRSGRHRTIKNQLRFIPYPFCAAI